MGEEAQPLDLGPQVSLTQRDHLRDPEKHWKLLQEQVTMWLGSFLPFQLQEAVGVASIMQRGTTSCACALQGWPKSLAFALTSFGVVPHCILGAMGSEGTRACRGPG